MIQNLHSPFLIYTMTNMKYTGYTTHGDVHNTVLMNNKVTDYCCSYTVITMQKQSIYILCSRTYKKKL